MVPESTDWIMWLSHAAATLGPISQIPTLWRIATKKTADGVSLDLCGVGLVSYGIWIVLAGAVRPYMYVLVIVSASLALIQTLYVRHLTRSPWTRVLGWLLAAWIGATLAGWSNLVALPLVLIIDVSWYWRAVSDMIGSQAARAVSTWGWVCSFLTNGAWTFETIVNSAWVLGAQCAVLTLASAVAWATAATMHRRDGEKSQT